MKSLRKLLKGIVSDGVIIMVVLVILLLLLIFASNGQSAEDLVLRLFGCMVLMVVALAAAGIYLAVRAG